MNTHTKDTTPEFHAALRDWDKMKKATDDEVAELIACAETAKAASNSSWEWTCLARHLNDLGDLNKEAASAEARRCRIVAALGRYPDNYADFIARWMSANGYTMNFNGEFIGGLRVPASLNHVLNEMQVWTDEKREFRTSYEAALGIWMRDERLNIIKQTFHSVAFDPTADPDMSELRRWVDLVVREEDDPDVTARNKLGVMIAVMNFIHRTKNHIAAMAGLTHPSGEQRWHHHTHVMPVLFGAQEDGKTLAVKTLLKVIEDLSTGMGFEVLEDNSKQNMLSFMPVMRFDELAGLKNANVEKLKGIMTEETRSMRDVFERASSKRVVSTFIGCTNEDINGLIRDKSGNRRFFQFSTKIVDVMAMKQIDAKRIWKSVDENAMSPWYAHADDLRVVKDMQAEQRHKSSVEDWIENCGTIPKNGGDWVSTNELFRSYIEYIEEFHRSEVNASNIVKFGRELSRLYGARNPCVEQMLNTKTKTNQYRIKPTIVSPSASVIPTASSLPFAANTNNVAKTLTFDEFGFPLESPAGESLSSSHAQPSSSANGHPRIFELMNNIKDRRLA